MAYEYDIFITYKRDPETLRWIKKHLEPLLTSEVGLARGHVPEVYVNEVVQQVPPGAAWPQALGETTATMFRRFLASRLPLERPDQRC